MDVSDIFFFLIGGREGAARGARKGQVSVFIENPRRGGVSQEVVGGRGAGRVSAGNGGGGAKYYFTRFFPRFQSALVNLVNVSRFLVSFKQIIQDKSAGISYRQEGGANQHPTNWSFVFGLPER